MRFTSSRWTRRLATTALAGFVIVAALLTAPIGSQTGVVGDAHASSDIDPCALNGADESNTPVQPSRGFNTGAGPAAFK